MVLYTEEEQNLIDAAIATLHRFKVPAVIWAPEDFEESARDMAPDATNSHIERIAAEAYRNAYRSHLTDCSEADWVSVEMLVSDAIG